MSCATSLSLCELVLMYVDFVTHQVCVSASCVCGRHVCVVCRTKRRGSHAMSLSLCELVLMYVDFVTYKVCVGARLCMFCVCGHHVCVVCRTKRRG